MVTLRSQKWYAGKFPRVITVLMADMHRVINYKCKLFYTPIGFCAATKQRGIKLNPRFYMLLFFAAGLRLMI